MKKKIVKIIALVTALLLIGGLSWFANAMVGNPVSRWLATRTAKTYLAEQYAGTDYEIYEVMYSFKDGNYYAKVNSPSSGDTDFYFRVNLGGKLLYDSYESLVANGQNTAHRLYSEYRALTDPVFDSPEFPYIADICYGDLQFRSREWPVTEFPYGYVMEELELDGVYDVGELGKTSARLVVYVDDETVTVERAAEIMLDIKNRMDAIGAGFYVMDFVLEYPRPAEGEEAREGRVETMDFLYADIYEEGMVERVRSANEEAESYHAARDAEWQKWLEENGQTMEE